MEGSQIHLGPTHVPVILSLVELMALVMSLLRKNNTLTKTVFYPLLFASITSIPVFVTTEAAKEIVDHLPAVSIDLIGTHEAIATVSFVLISVAAFVSLIGLLRYNKAGAPPFARPVILALDRVTAYLMAVKTHLGGQVCPTEIHCRFTQQTQNGNGDERRSKSLGGNINPYFDLQSYAA